MSSNYTKIPPSKHVVEKKLEYHWAVAEAKWHDQIFPVTTGVLKAVFHSSPSLMRMRLYAFLRSKRLKMVA